MIQTMAKNKEAISLALKIDFDNLMPHAGSSNRVTGLSMYVMNVGAVAFGKISDLIPGKMSPTGMDNVMGHYPAGESHR